jgi:hypothetical protein
MPDPLQLTRTKGEPGRYLFGQYKNVAIAVWLASADGKATTEMARFTDRIAQEWNAFSIVHVVEASAGLPTREGRDGLVATARSHQAHLASVGALLLQSSMLATLMRAFVRGIRTLVRGGIDIQIEQHAASLAGWMAPRHSERTGVRITVSELGGLIAVARDLAAAQLPARA